MFYCLTNLVLKRSKRFKWTNRQNSVFFLLINPIGHLDDDYSKEKWEWDQPTTEHLCFSLPPLSQKGPFLWLATIYANSLHYEIGTSKPMGIKISPLFGWSRENMIVLVMFWSPPRVTYSFFSIPVIIKH